MPQVPPLNAVGPASSSAGAGQNGDCLRRLLTDPDTGKDLGEINEQIRIQLKRLRMSGMTEAYQEMLPEFTEEQQIFLADSLLRIVEAEKNVRDSHKLANMIRSAGFQYPSACPEEIVHIPDRTLDTDMLKKLTSGEFIQSGHHAILVGATGCGPV